MSYHLSSQSDTSVHRRFHAKSLSGISFPSAASSGEEEEGVVVVITPSSPQPLKKKVREVLEVIDTELGAAEIPDEVLWAGGYRVFVRVEEGKVVGLLVAERIEEAFLAVGEGSVGLGERRRAVLGVCRVWTAREWRRRGVARGLIERARRGLVYGVLVGRGEVAFSQTTESGEGLARGWWRGVESGWCMLRGWGSFGVWFGLVLGLWLLGCWVVFWCTCGWSWCFVYFYYF
ncbi:ESCO1/2 acetyl-transferase-domain-containing protein [Trichophaea hybrida]|nr:ESCO1/2 acetyl-transferase-domain-containing protein [Trichophaea hybrida]